MELAACSRAVSYLFHKQCPCVRPTLESRAHFHPLIVRLLVLLAIIFCNLAHRPSVLLVPSLGNEPSFGHFVSGEFYFKDTHDYVHYDMPLIPLDVHVVGAYLKKVSPSHPASFNILRDEIGVTNAVVVRAIYDALGTATHITNIGLGADRALRPYDKSITCRCSCIQLPICIGAYRTYSKLHGHMGAFVTSNGAITSNIGHSTDCCRMHSTSLSRLGHIYASTHPSWKVLAEAEFTKLYKPAASKARLDLRTIQISGASVPEFLH